MSTNPGRGEVLGIVGGMGPLASAEFLRTLYAHALAGAAGEQELPAVVMHSDPGIPDRTTAFLEGDDDAVLEHLEAALERLEGCGATQIVLCCVTLHHLLPRLPLRTRERIVSLLDLVFAEVERAPGPHLLLSTTGTRRLGLFQAHPEWARLEDRIVLPDAADQTAVHEAIYRLKRTGDAAPAAALVERLVARYGARSFIAGCTELHMVARHLEARSPGAAGGGSWPACIDPLTTIAHGLVEAYA